MELALPNRSRLARTAAVLIAMMALLLTGRPMHAAPIPDFSGTYANEKVTLVLRAGASTAAYEGTVTVNGKAYPCQASVDPIKGFHGAFTVDAKQFAITIQPHADGSMVLVSGDSKYELRRQAGGVPGTNPAGPDLAGFFKPGFRMSFQTGKSTREGASVVQDPNGWIIRDGRRYSIVGNVGVGVEGFRHVTLQDAQPDAVIGEVRNFIIQANLQGKFIAAAGYDVATGNAAAVPDYWVHPAALAQLPPGREEDGQTTYKRKFTVGKQEFDAITIYRFGATGYSSTTYDLATGVLLYLIRTSASPDILIRTNAGNYQFNGSIDIERLTFVNARQIEFAWGGEGVPPWAVKGFRMDYRGGYRLDVKQDPGLPPLPPMQGFAASATFQFQGGTKNALIGPWSIVRQVDRGGIADQANGARCFGNHMYVGGLWASPRVLQKLQPNQVLDQDAITGFRTVFAGVRGNVAVLVEQGPAESLEASYDMQSGALVGWKHVSQPIPSSVRTEELQLVPQQ